MAKIHTVELDLNFELFNRLNAIDRFSGEWSYIEKREGIQSLKQLKTIATVQSVGASTRIEGAKLTNDQIERLLMEELKIGRFEDRDRQEVLGYYETLELISNSYHEIHITERDVMNLHKVMLKYSDKDQWHRGGYKQHPNSVDAHYPDGRTITIFKTAKPGNETENGMRQLTAWYGIDHTTPPVVKTAVFVYDFLSIHPFQDGNGRLSRLLGTLLLLKEGYPWVQFVSFEQEIENRKAEYYKVLMDCQQNRPGENINSWLSFFLSCLDSIREKLIKKLEAGKQADVMTPRQKQIRLFIELHPGAKSGEIAENLNIPLPTIKRQLAEMVALNMISKFGIGKATYYTAGEESGR